MDIQTAEALTIVGQLADDRLAKLLLGIGVSHFTVVLQKGNA